MRPANALTKMSDAERKKFFYDSELLCPNCGARNTIHASGQTHHTMQLGLCSKILSNIDKPSTGPLMIYIVKCWECHKEWGSIEEFGVDLVAKGIDVDCEESSAIMAEKNFDIIER